MALPVTTRQYLPDLEKRWDIPRTQIVEYARDGELDLWIELFNVNFCYEKADGGESQEPVCSIKLKFYLSSLEQLCKNVDISTYHNTLQLDKGQTLDVINGILEDGRKVLVKHKQSIRPMGYKESPEKILIKYSQVYARIEDVIEFERKFLDEEGETSSVRLPFLDPSHEFYSEELALAVKAWLSLYGEGGTYKPNQAHKKQIQSTLDPKKLSNEAIMRISTLVNPKKKGGSPFSGF